MSLAAHLAPVHLSIYDLPTQQPHVQERSKEKATVWRKVQQRAEHHKADILATAVGLLVALSTEGDFGS